MIMIVFGLHTQPAVCSCWRGSVGSVSMSNKLLLKSTWLLDCSGFFQQHRHGCLADVSAAFSPEKGLQRNADYLKLQTKDKTGS